MTQTVPDISPLMPMHQDPLLVVTIIVNYSVKYWDKGPLTAILKDCAKFDPHNMDLLPDTWIWGLCMRRECRERFPRHRLQNKPLTPGMHHDTCVTHVPWCMSGSLTRSGGENVPGIPDACATRNFTHLVRGPWSGRVRVEIHFIFRRTVNR